MLRAGFFVGILLFMFGCGEMTKQPAAQNSNKVIIGYVFSPDEKLDPDTIAAEKLTHINYAFSNIIDGKMVEGFAYDAENYRTLQTLKQRNPNLKILSSVGGWTWSGGFSDMALSAEARQQFIASALDFVRRHQLDGIDIDWEYPGLPGAGNPHRPEDGANFTLLLRDLRSQLDQLEKELQRPLLLTIASGGFARFIEMSDIGNWQKYLDFINIMAYDYNFPTDGNHTGHHAGLYTNPDDITSMSADAAVRDHLAAGVPAHKLVLGVAFYGRQWVNVHPENNGLYQVGYTGETGFGDNRYSNLAPSLVNKQGFVRYWDAVARAPWLWNAEQQIFISYDDAQSLREKSSYVLQHGLGGIMFWQYTSDYNNELLNTIYDVFQVAQ